MHTHASVRPSAPAGLRLHLTCAFAWPRSCRRPLLQLNVPQGSVTVLNAAARPLRIQFARLNFGQNTFRALEECLLDVVARLRARLQKDQLVLLRKVAGLEHRYFARLLQVLFVANQQYDDVRAGQVAGVVEPIGERVE